MDLHPYVTQLHRDLTAAAATGDDAVRLAAERLAGALDAAARLVLLDALVTAADELSVVMGASIEVRLRSGAVALVATALPPVDDPTPPLSAVTDELDDATARVSLRLPEQLKAAAEAQAASDRTSLNIWIVRAITGALDGGQHRPRRGPHGAGPGTRLSGWAQS